MRIQNKFQSWWAAKRANLLSLINDIIRWKKSDPRCLPVAAMVSIGSTHPSKTPWQKNDKIKIKEWQKNDKTKVTIR